MHKKTETRVELHWIKREDPRLRIDELDDGTYLVDEHCELYLKGAGCILNVATGRFIPMAPGQAFPGGFRVVPKVTFHVELEGEG